MFVLLVPCVGPDEVTDLFKLYMEKSVVRGLILAFIALSKLSKLHFKHTIIYPDLVTNAPFSVCESLSCTH